jgi:hypothetical protein
MAIGLVDRGYRGASIDGGQEIVVACGSLIYAPAAGAGGGEGTAQRDCQYHG